MAAFVALKNKKNKKKIDTRSNDILQAPQKQLEEITRMGGIIPELRAQRLHPLTAECRYFQNLAG